jgi:hypothetical protein
MFARNMRVPNEVICVDPNADHAGIGETLSYYLYFCDIVKFSSFPACSASRYDLFPSLGKIYSHIMFVE